ncbi:SKI family transcriptional corepressor 2-like [Amphibalanus amphitrite]|uniref:SKI family transcriptional corepressor 2-like n=2 Tax=Amphibalanus amphitrite TaxID=1232801 RepID=UPI001C90D299|nr:SKI family transcriptional corepressor 2-like [Amphibalanus amphitrite]
MMEIPDSTVRRPAGATEPGRSRSEGSSDAEDTQTPAHNQVSTVVLYGVPIVSLTMDGKDRLCLAQISNTLLKSFSYNEIHNRRVALGITCIQCTPVQLEILRRAGAMPVSSRRCGMITKREAERLCKSFLGDNSPPKLPDNFTFDVLHQCAWGCQGQFYPARYNSSRAKCIKCTLCATFFSPNKFIFHSHRTAEATYVQPDAANFNSWRRHIRLHGSPPEEIVHAWEDVKAMFNGGTRKRAGPAAAAAAPAAKTARSEPSGTSAVDLVTSYPEPSLVRPTPSLVAPPAAACFPRLPAFGAYKRLSALEPPSFSDYLWPAGKWAELAPLAAPGHLWPKRAAFGFPLAAPAMLGGLVDYSGLYAGLPLSAEPPAIKPPKSPPAAAAAAAAASAFRPLRQPWLTDGEAEVSRGQALLEAEVRARASLEAQLRSQEAQESAEDGERRKSLEDDCRAVADTTQDPSSGQMSSRSAMRDGTARSSLLLLKSE